MIGGHDTELHRAARSTYTDIPIAIKHLSGSERPEAYLDNIYRKIYFPVSILAAFFLSNALRFKFLFVQNNFKK